MRSPTRRKVTLQIPGQVRPRFRPPEPGSVNIFGKGFGYIGRAQCSVCFGLADLASIHRFSTVERPSR